MTRVSASVFNRALAGLGSETGQSGSTTVDFRARNTCLDTPFRAAEAAAAALAAGADIAGQLAGHRGAAKGGVQLDSRHVEGSLTSFAHLRFDDPERGLSPRIPGEFRTAAAGFYPTADDRLLYLHSGFPHNTKGLLNLLGVSDNRDAVAGAVANRTGVELEQAIGRAGLCGAMVRTAAEWDASIPGQLLAARPAVDIIQMGDSDPEPFPEDNGRPLNGIKVLDLTRILAGPTCARTLASYGAGVLRVGAPHLPSVPLFVVDTGFGKRACHLDLSNAADSGRLKRLLKQSDVFSQGYRSGAMERRGFGVTDAIRTRPGLVYVSINCYGHEGDWRPRPGWEQLAQTVTGMAARQGQHVDQSGATLLPAAVNDYITGYLAAYGALVALKRRAESGGSYWVRVSLARTAMWTRSLGLRNQVQNSRIDTNEIQGFSATTDSAWGPLQHLRPAVSLTNTTVSWTLPPEPLGSSKPSFDSRPA